MSKHTPGPWTISDRDSVGDNIFGPNNERIANTYGLFEEKWAANARLIAAAPDLLAACKAAMDFMDEKGYGGNTYRLLRIGILKAEGKS